MFLDVFLGYLLIYLFDVILYLVLQAKQANTNRPELVSPFLLFPSLPLSLSLSFSHGIHQQTLLSILSPTHTLRRIQAAAPLLCGGVGVCDLGSEWRGKESASFGPDAGGVVAFAPH